jgi:dTDP-4-amino-4,6-dideoxygalactose transaminase
LIPFLDLQAQYLSIKPDIEKAVLGVLDSGQFVLGEAVESFEKSFADYCGTRHCVALNTGTSALHLALLASGIGPGDEVITVPMTFAATVGAIFYVGAKPVLVDIDPLTWTMDPDGIEAAITPWTRAIMPVHLHGQMADMAPIREIASRHGLIVIEDAAQAHGAEYQGRRAGAVGNVGCFSFYPGKNLGACGEGGALTTDDDDVARTARMLRDWGQSSKYHHALKGYNYRMDGIQGAVLSVKMRHIEAWTRARQELAAEYTRMLEGTGIQTPSVPAGQTHVFHVYAVLVQGRDEIRTRMESAGIATNIHYPVPVHLQPAYAELSSGPGSFPVAEAVARNTLSLPLYPELGFDQVATVAKTLAELLEAVA